MARFSCATWRPISANTGGRLSPNLGLVLHHAVANGSLFGFFNSPAAEVSAHFWVAQSGLVEQYVDTDVVAWHGVSLNSRYVGVETEGCSVAPYADPMSEAMVAGLAAIFAEGMARHGWPAALAERDGDAGFGYHRMAVSTACPCDVRLNRRAEILAMAAGGTVPAPPSSPPPSSSSGPAPPWPGVYLDDFTEDPAAATWQAQMAARGWSITVDGCYGEQSAWICTLFQEEKGLEADGIVGPETWAATWAAPVT